jgi:hypothetical protein
MRRYVKISAVILAWCILCGKSCDEDTESQAVREVKRTEAARDSIRTAFASDYLPESMLASFEKTGIQKLSDLPDYLRLTADRSLDTALRGKAAEMARQLFVSGNASIRLPGLPGHSEKVLPAGEYLDRLLGGRDYDGIPAIDSVIVLEPLRRVKSRQYEGSLAFRMVLKGLREGDTALTAPIHITIDISAGKVKKAFGSDTLEVWNVFLGDME